MLRDTSSGVLYFGEFFRKPHGEKVHKVTDYLGRAWRRMLSLLPFLFNTCANSLYLGLFKKIDEGCLYQGTGRGSLY